MPMFPIFLEKGGNLGWWNMMWGGGRVKVKTSKIIFFSFALLFDQRLRSETLVFTRLDFSGGG